MKRIILFLAVIAIEHVDTSAQTFSALAPTGQMLYYWYESGEVSIVYPCYNPNADDHYWGYTKPEGNLTIPDSVIFGGITYPVTSIDSYAFHNCSELTSVTMPNTITNIAMSAFQGCSGLSSVFIPNSVTTIGAATFEGCSSLSSVNIPNSVTSIPSQAFYGCSNLTSVIMPNTITNIETSAFFDCFSLTSINIPNSVTTIHSYAFCGCRGLTSVTIPNSVTYIGSHAFEYCSGLASVTIGRSIDTIGDRAFCMCDSLTTIYFNAINCSYAGSNYLTRAFRNCDNVSAVIFGDSVVIIPPYLLWGCAEITNVTIPNRVTYIGEGSFYSCWGLTSLYIPIAVTSIGGGAFSRCTGLTSITMRCYPPTIDSNTFSGFPLYIPISVPCGALSIYQNTQYWNNFTNFVEGCVTITVTANDFTLGGVTGGGTFTAGDTVTLTAIPYFGSRFIGWSNGSQENPLTFVATTSQNFVAAFAVDSLPQDTVYIHDTTYIIHENHDTVFVNHYVHDTLINYIHDTTFINNYIHDTLFYPVYIHDTTIVNHFVYDTVYLEIYIHDTVYRDRYIHDTIYVHDTIYLGGESIDDITLLNAKIYQRNGQIVVDGAEGNPVYLYDVVGRLLATKRETAQEVLLDVPASGAYLVKIGDAPARRIVVKR